MRIGISISAPRPSTSYQSLVDQAVEAERQGFESLWLNAGIAGDALTTIAIAGRETSRIGFGTGVLQTYTRHPLAMAQQALTTNAAIGGRLTLGIGPSHRGTMERLGFSYDRVAQRMREYVTVLRALLDERKVDFHGEFYDLEAALQFEWAVSCPIVLAALGPLMLKTAGELADGTVTWMVGPRTLETHIAPRLRDAALAAGRPSPRIIVGAPVAVTDDPEAARTRAAEALRFYAVQPNYRRVLDMEGGGPADVAICGDEAAVEQELRRFAAAGATEFYGAPFAVGANPAASIQRTRELLSSLVGRV